MIKKLTMFFACLILSTGLACAQMAVKGTVVSADDGEPVVGATILVVGTQTGTVTDVEGKFSLTMPSGRSILRITYVGMEPLEVSARPNMRIVLTSDQQALDEVIVVAFGTQKRSSFTGSAAVVGSDELSQKITTTWPMPSWVRCLVFRSVVRAVSPVPRRVISTSVVSPRCMPTPSLW